MYCKNVVASVVAGAVSLASAQMAHVVSVGSTAEGKALTFGPNKITAAAGDMIQFQFRAGNHTVTQSTFDQPCVPLRMSENNDNRSGNTTASSAGVYSGFMAVSASAEQGEIPVYTIRVENTNPMWFYCSQGRHCQNGMVMVVNENTGTNSTRSLENFVQLAQAAPVNLPGDPSSIDRGSIGTVPADGTSGNGYGNGDATANDIIGASAAPGGLGKTRGSCVLALGAAAAVAVVTSKSLFFW